MIGGPMTPAFEVVFTYRDGVVVRVQLPPREGHTTSDELVRLAMLRLVDRYIDNFAKVEVRL